MDAYEPNEILNFPWFRWPVQSFVRRPTVLFLRTSCRFWSLPKLAGSRSKPTHLVKTSFFNLDKVVIDSWSSVMYLELSKSTNSNEGYDSKDGMMVQRSSSLHCLVLNSKTSPVSSSTTMFAPFIFPSFTRRTQWLSCFEVRNKEVFPSKWVALFGDLIDSIRFFLVVARGRNVRMNENECGQQWDVFNIDEKGLSVPGFILR